MKSGFFMFSILFVSQFSFSRELSDFEEMLSGFPECKFDGVYLDLEKQLPQHEYFTDRNMKPEKVEGYLAQFKVDEMYYGLHVSEIYIPASTFSVIAIVIDDKKITVESYMKSILVNGYNREFVEGREDPAMIIVPTIEEYKENREKTVMSCINPV